MTSTSNDGRPWPQGPDIWVGTNFWSRAGGPRMWARYDGDVVREELAVLADHGCTLTRSFCYWPDFMPTPGALDEEVMERFVDFLDLHRHSGMWTIPTFIVGHMSGENWDPAWRGGRDLYRDVWMVAQQAWFVAAVAARVARHPTVAGWLLTNEMPLYGAQADQETVTAWAMLLVQALRSTGATQPVSIGDGAWGIETSGEDNGFSLRRLAPIVDFIGPHVYLSSDDPVRQMLAAAFACELSGSFGKPVVLEEFGLSSDMASGEHAAHYYRQVLHSSLLAGARGWLAWNNCDYDGLANQDPYRHHPFEMHFGITDHAGRPKPQALELARFSRLVADLTKAGWQRGTPEVAIVVPEHFEHSEATWSKFSRGDMRPNLFQSYIAAREADLPVALVRERDLTEDGSEPPSAKLYLLPCAKMVTTGGVQTMLGLARSGATVYASYFAGSTKQQLGPWMPWLEQVFGVKHHLRYGLADTIEGDEVTLELVKELGELAPGSKLTFPVGGEGVGRAYLPVEPTMAEVLAIDGRGRPALLRNADGDGSMVLCTYPLEYMAACRPEANPEPTWQLYSALAGAAGVTRPVRVEDPRVIVGSLSIGGGRDGGGGLDGGGLDGGGGLGIGKREAFLALNISPSTVKAKLLAPGRSVYAGGASGQNSLTELDLGPYEVTLFYGS
jgi:endo-1,4-beta-mannosidase